MLPRLSLATLSLATLSLATLLVALLLIPQAVAATHDQTTATTVFSKAYHLPPPLPTKGRIVPTTEASFVQALQKNKNNTGAFRPTYRLAQTFAVRSLASRKPVQSTERFQKLTRLPDPLENLNRSFFRTAVLFEKAVYRPLAKGWRKIPRPLTAPIINFSRNLSRTTYFLNALAQGNAKRASEVFFAFVIDSTLGFAGLINLSKHLGIPQVEEDFGQTLAHYGVGHGPYFVSILLGPSSVRDTTGQAVDLVGNIYGNRHLAPYWNPLHYLLFVETGASAGVGIGVGLGLSVLRGIDRYSKAIDQIEAIEQGSIDFYAATRRFYAYSRALQVLNADQSSLQELESPELNLQNDPFADPFADIEE